MAKPTTKKTPKPATKAAAVKKTAVKTIATKAAVKKVAPVKTAVKKTAVKKVAAKKTTTKSTKSTQAPSAAVTTVIAKCDAGFGNTLTIRGGGGGLNWDSGVTMENVAASEWVWKSTEVTGELEFKVLLNDQVWSTGQNGVVFAGSTIVFEPGF